LELSGRFRTIFGALAGLALISAAVPAIDNGTPPAPAAVASEGDVACTGDCATCPHAQDQPCPPETTENEQTAVARVDADKCIGCVGCVNVAPEAFRMNPETRKAEVVAGASAEDIQRGVKACPVDAIVQ